MARKRVATAQEANQKWVQAMGQASAAYAAGVAAVTVSPMQAAATPEAMNKYLNGVNQSVASGRRAAALNAGTLQGWQAAATAKASRLATGAQGASAKQMAAAQKLQPIWQAQRDAAAGVQGAQAKWLAAMQVMANHSGKPLT